MGNPYGVSRIDGRRIKEECRVDFRTSSRKI